MCLYTDIVSCESNKCIPFCQGCDQHDKNTGGWSIHYCYMVYCMLLKGQIQHLTNFNIKTIKKFLFIWI